MYPSPMRGSACRILAGAGCGGKQDAAVTEVKAKKNQIKSSRLGVKVRAKKMKTKVESGLCGPALDSDKSAGGDFGGRGSSAVGRA